MNNLNRLVLTMALPIILTSGAALAHNHNKDGDSHQDKAKSMHMQELDKQFKNLDLTDAQKEKIKGIRAQYKDMIPSKGDTAAKDAMHQERLNNMDAVKKLVQADTFDESAARKLLETQNQKQLDRRVQWLKMRHEIYAVLTPEQKMKFTSMKEERMNKRDSKK